ncbi:MAG: dTDP-4-dehydrorhamnose 3,5-epimerase, partial [uncultured Acidimicrobiales bacterium]
DLHRDGPQRRVHPRPRGQARRPWLLRPDVLPGRVRGPRPQARRGAVQRVGEPPCRDPPRHALPAGAGRRDEARPLHLRGHPRRDHRHAAGLPDLPRARRRRAHPGEPQGPLRPRHVRPRVPGADRRRRGELPGGRVLHAWLRARPAPRRPRAGDRVAPPGDRHLRQGRQLAAARAGGVV